MTQQADIRTPRVFRYASGLSGPEIAIVGFVHGDENSGEAIVRLPALLGQLRRGRVTLIEAHPAARQRGTRFIDEDLNRIFAGDDDCRPGMEADIACRIKLALTGTEVVIDLHATTEASRPFAVSFTGDSAVKDLVRRLGIPLVTGFNHHLKGTLLEWASGQGRQALAIECGRKGEEATAEAATRLVVSALGHYGMLAAERGSDAGQLLHYHVVGSTIVRDRSSFRYGIEPEGFSELPPRTVVGEDRWKKYRSPGTPTHLVMPASPEAIRCYEGPAFFFAQHMSEERAISCRR